MKTRIRSKKLLAMVVALAALAATWAIWGARPAKAIIIVNGKTGAFTLTSGQGAKLNVVNATDAVAIIDDGKIVDHLGNPLVIFPEIRVPPGETTSFEFTLPPDEGVRMTVRAELMISSSSSRARTLVIPTLEVFDTATGKTNVLLGQDFIIDDGK
jgi:hypothetical protein